MRALETCVIYGLVGVAIAIAVWVREESSPPPKRALLAVAALAFWPLLAPVVFGSRGGGAAQVRAGGRLAAVEAQLLEAIASLQGLVGELVAPEVARVRGLLGALGGMEKRLAEMDAMLATAEFDPRAAEATLADLAARGVPEGDPRVQSARGRLRSASRLVAMRARTSEDLERVVLRLEELSAQLKLLKFAGRADADVARAIRDIADGVEEVSEGLLSETEPATPPAA